GAPLCSECIADYPWPYGNHCPGPPYLTTQEQYSCQGCWHSCVLDYTPHDPPTDYSDCTDQFTAEFESADYSCQSSYFYGTPAPAICNDVAQCTLGRQCAGNSCVCSNGSDPYHFDDHGNIIRDPCP